MPLQLFEAADSIRRNVVDAKTSLFSTLETSELFTISELGVGRLEPLSVTPVHLWALLSKDVILEGPARLGGPRVRDLLLTRVLLSVLVHASTTTAAARAEGGDVGSRP